MNAIAGTELWLRHVKLDDRSVAILRGVDTGENCTVQADVYPPNGGDPISSGPYVFPDAGQATAFVAEALNSLMHLGCDVFAE